jgi:hypothetical protein
MRDFVEIIAKDRRALRRLQQHDVDLVRHTAARHPRGFAVDGLLTRAEAQRLRGDGYEVRVLGPASERSRAHLETTTFEAWLAALEKE